MGEQILDVRLVQRAPRLQFVDDQVLRTGDPKTKGCEVGRCDAAKRFFIMGGSASPQIEPGGSDSELNHPSFPDFTLLQSGKPEPDALQVLKKFLQRCRFEFCHDIQVMRGTGSSPDADGNAPKYEVGQL